MKVAIAFGLIFSISSLSFADPCSDKEAEFDKAKDLAVKIDIMTQYEKLNCLKKEKLFKFYAVRGLYRKAIGRYTEAIDDFTKILSLEIDDRNRAEVLYTRALAFGSGKDADFIAGEKDLREAVRLDPGNIKYNITLARSIKVTKGSEEADKVITSLLEKRPNDPEVVEALANYYDNSQQFKKAASNWEKLIQLDPEKPEAYLKLAQSYRYLEDFEAAYKTYRKLYSITNNPYHFYEAIQILEWYYKKGELEIHLEHRKLLLRDHPDFVPALRDEAKRHRLNYNIGCFNYNSYVYKNTDRCQELRKIAVESYLLAAQHASGEEKQELIQEAEEIRNSYKRNR